MGKHSNQVAGYRFKLRNHSGLTYGPIDAYLEFRGGDRTAWAGRQTVSGTLDVNAPQLFGGDKDQGGIVGDLYVMMGEDDQAPNAMLVSAFGDQTGAWRGFATVAFDGLYGSNNPYPQPQSHKIEKILKGWDGDVCWYPEKAVISPLDPHAELVVLDARMGDWRFLHVAAADSTDRSSVAFDDSSWATGTAPFGAWEAGYGAPEIAAGAPAALNSAAAYDARFAAEFASVWAVNTRVWLRRTLTLSGIPTGLDFVLYIEDHCSVWVNGTLILTTPANPSGGIGQTFHVADHHLVLGDNIIAVRCDDEAPSSGISVTYFDMIVSASAVLLGGNYINPAHALYYLRTQSHKGGEPTANIDDASFTAAADRLFNEGFGICVRHDPDQESVEDVENRIGKLIMGSVNRSPVDGTLHLDLARGDYVLEDLPVVSDDDILDFSESPTTPEGAVNSVSVRYFDPQRKETIITPSVDALGLIDEFGLNHQVIDYPEIPFASLAVRIATRELLQFITPSRAFDLVCKPSVYALQPNQYFRLQIPKRGIDDMVCIVGDKQGGTLKSGAIRLQAAQVADTLPDFASIDIETGVDPTPPTTPMAIAQQIAFEAPYVNVCAAFSAADLAALPAEAGFLIAAAQDPANSRDFTLAVDAGAGYAEQGDGDWSPTLVVNEAAALEDPLPVDFTFSAGTRLGDVVVGDLALWGGTELCRVDALDVGAGTLTLGRACADTVPQAHAAGEMLWIYGEGAAHDGTQYSDGETVAAKLLTNTFTKQLASSAATPLSVTFDMRQVRPYPPGQFKIDGSYYPTANAATASMAVTWAHRDRVQQADQLVDTTAASVGPEATVRYGLRCLNASTGALILERLDLAGPSANVILNFTGNVTVQLYAISDNGESLQRHAHTLAYTKPVGTVASSITGGAYVPDEIIVDGGHA